MDNLHKIGGTSCVICGIKSPQGKYHSDDECKQMIQFRNLVREEIASLQSKPERKDFTLKDLQVRLPWTIKYSEDFRKNPMSHKDFAHGLTHVSKAAGKLSEFVDKMDHNKELALKPECADEYGKYIADLVICAVRMANTFPGGHIDLGAEVVKRLETKNGVKLT